MPYEYLIDQVPTGQPSRKELRIARNYRERFALTLVDQGGDLASRDRLVGLRVCLAADAGGFAPDLPLERIGVPMGITTAEVRASLRRLQRARWLESLDLGEQQDAYTLVCTVPWWATTVETSVPGDHTEDQAREVSEALA